MMVKRAFLFKILVLIGVFILFGLDQITKNYIVEYFYYQQFKSIFSVLNLVYTTNNGSLFGLFSDWPWINYLLAFFGLSVSIWAFFYLIKNKLNLYMVLFLMFLMGGALGNTSDRFVYGHVIDWIDFHIGNWHWPAFNLADVSINLAIFFLVLDWLQIQFFKRSRNEVFNLSE